jgi:hypothetical protein
MRRISFVLYFVFLFSSINAQAMFGGFTGGAVGRLSGGPPSGVSMGGSLLGSSSGPIPIFGCGGGGCGGGGQGGRGLPEHPEVTR